MEINFEAVRIDLEREIAEWQKGSKSKIDEFSESMSSAVSVATLKSEYYRFRFDYVTKRFDMQNRVAEIQEMRKNVIRGLLVSSKLKQAIDPDFEDFKFEPKNADEREIFEDNYLRQLDRVLSVLNNSISLINDAIMTIDKIIFGIPYVIEYEKYKSHFE